MAAPLRAAHPRPYRDYLTPSLHQRFTHASYYTLAACYTIACYMGSLDDYLWSWFPIGPVGVRALLLFIPALIVFILRVAQWHVGARNTRTPFETFQTYCFRKSTISTFVLYLLSAWVYSEIYIWSRSDAGKLQMQAQGKPHERIRLNERPLYMRFMFASLAVAQGVLHLWKDYDRIDVPGLQPKRDRNEVSNSIPEAPIPRRELLKRIRPMAMQAGITAVVTFIAGSLAYFVFFRYRIWNNWFNLWRYYLGLGKYAKPTGLQPFGSVVLMFVSQGVCLSLLWSFVNTSFDLYIAQSPLKKGQPITNDSKDPNGSLLNGLKSKKDSVKAIAFWEAALITERFSDRRKTIFAEQDRKKAATYKQITDACLSEVRFLIKRMKHELDPASTSADEHPGPKAPPEHLALVSRISSPPKEGEIYGPSQKPQSRWQKVETLTADIARTHSSPHNAQNAKAREILHSGSVKAVQGADKTKDLVTKYWDILRGSPIGYPFRPTLCRVASMVVTGEPYSRLSPLCNAITILTNLAVTSISEDVNGRFHESVPEIIAVFTFGIKLLDQYTATVEIPWSDLKTPTKTERHRKKVKVVQEVESALKEGLREILGAFNEYLTGMGMEARMIADAKKAASKGPEMGYGLENNRWTGFQMHERGR